MKKCITAFATADRTVAAGTLVEDSDDVVNGHEEFFVDVSAEPQAGVIPGTDKVEAKPRSNDEGDDVPDQNQQPEDEGGLPVSTQSGPGAAEAERRQAEGEPLDDEKNDDYTKRDAERGPERRVTTQPVEEATANPGERRTTRRGDRA